MLINIYGVSIKLSDGFKKGSILNVGVLKQFKRK